MCRFLAKSNGRLHGSADTGVFLQPHRQREHGLTSNQIRIRHVPVRDNCCSNLA